jgi:excisionase family DNA binding protein
MRQVSSLSAELLAEIAQVVRTEVGAAIREVLEPTMARMLVSGPGHCRGAVSEPEFYSVQQTCDLLCISKSEFYRMAKRGDIHPIKRGRSTLVARAEVEGLIARMKRGVR